jgi:ABC-type transporter Mla maintaining outer membrane lipid asymmetry ATPase subunit MlaF
MQGYRTYIVAALIAASGALATTDWVKFIDDPKAGLVAIGAAVIMALMRSITNTPPGQQS